MTHVSKHEISKGVEVFIFERFIELLTSVKNKKEAKFLFESVFTKTEQVMFAKRLAAIYMLHEQKTFEEIGMVLKVSPTTISKISLSKENKQLVFVEKFLDKRKSTWDVIEKLLYFGMPKIGKGRYDWVDKL